MGDLIHREGERHEVISIRQRVARLDEEEQRSERVTRGPGMHILVRR
ncbi:hypothetical protein [Archangium sp.]|nr:hypothetical protein [Archangium sp.]HYO53403.1 hypothetical protein [Archangium sp.]